MRQTEAVRLGRLILRVAAAIVLMASCTSTTVVSERADRPAVAASDGDRANADAAADDEEDPAADQDDAAADEDDAADEDSAVEDSAGEDSADEDSAGEDSADEDSVGEDSAVEEIEDDESFGIGGDEQLAGLLEDCQGGSDQACDILFQLSPPDSAEEEVALTCGGRAADEEVDFCTSGVDANAGSYFFDLASPGLDDIATACEDGDMTACDFLYFRSPVGSRYEELGTSCGGRTTVAIPDCRTAIG